MFLDSGVPCHNVAKEFSLYRNTLRKYSRKIQGGQTTNFVSLHKSKQVLMNKKKNCPLFRT